MKRFKHRIKRETAETARQADHDLAYYIHDRVELMDQVFSVLKSKELRAMAPQCVRDISINDLQELCTEELLGISSKRLCAVLDGADPPSNTESSDSSPDRMETISLDSISSDEEILSQASSRKKKHKRHSKSKRDRRHEASECEANGETQQAAESEASRATRAGLTVLELLELQARARAIRAQLQQAQSEQQVSCGRVESSDDEVVIKEEAPEVVEISSDEEKPDPRVLDKQIENKETTTVTRRINDLIITVPQTKPTRKIKLNRQKTSAAAVPQTAQEAAVDSNVADESKAKNKTKKKQKKVKRANKDGSDNDEIMLQLSDTEKMDLLEDLEEKSTEDSESSSDSSDTSGSDSEVSVTNDGDAKQNTKKKNVNYKNDTEKANGASESDNNKIPNVDSTKLVIDQNVEEQVTEKTNNVTQTVVTTDIRTNNEEESKDRDESMSQNVEKESLKKDNVGKLKEMEVNHSLNEHDQGVVENVEEGEITEGNKELSDGEVSQDSIVMKVAPDVVTVSGNDKEKKKKEKKSRKAKKCKKKDFHEDPDQNFYTQQDNTDKIIANLRSGDKVENDLLNGDRKCICYEQAECKDNVADDDVIELLELSDDSSCYEVEGVSVLSKEPTAEEIAALSAKIDEIERIEVVSEREIALLDMSEAEHTTWKDRYLESAKVKKVMNTSNILNAIRKKNKELKNKMEESKAEKTTTEKPQSERVEEQPQGCVVEGSIDHYNTLEGSTKFVDPVRDEIKVSKEMESDAKLLLKMYKKLLKYNDINRKKDPNRKKKKKKNKMKEKSKDGA